ncbi:unnamed protein product [Camellia sinensis]
MLVIVPREGERVFYFPQGHIEQLVVLKQTPLQDRILLGMLGCRQLVALVVLVSQRCLVPCRILLH